MKKIFTTKVILDIHPDGTAEVKYEVEMEEPTPQKECEHKWVTKTTSERDAVCSSCGKKYETTEPKQDNPQKTDWVEAVERLVILYANLSGRETAHRAEFREKAGEIISNLLSEKQKETREEIGREVEKWFNDIYTEESPKQMMRRILGIKI